MSDKDRSIPINNNLPKAYDASQVEDKIYRQWEKSGAFNPDKLPKRDKAGEPYCIAMPPPNRTGTLHLGHAMTLTIEDLLIRFARARGKKALWIPGTDHAAIATQVKVEQLLREQGYKDPRRELGREKFLDKVVEFAEESANTMRRQMRKLGSSCDWSREKYTLDKERSAAVNEMFKMMHEDGIIERGFRLVNWDPQFRTTLSDDEVLMKEAKAGLWTFRYDANFPIPIATTRPETKLGDTAVAVNPKDKRYAKYVGKVFEPIFCGKKLTIKIVADEAVDPEFGTGAVGVTPAHSMVDWDMAERHGLPLEQVIGEDGMMTDATGKSFAGLTVLEARSKIVSQLERDGLLLKTEEIVNNVPTAERGGALVEQLPMRQWFVRVNKPFVLRQDTLMTPLIRGATGGFRKGDKATLKDLMRHAVESKQVKIVPERFEKIYFHWIDNLRDWCISRQIWFGHRVPVWYRTPLLTKERGRGEVDPVISDKSPGRGWEQDPDTLDTWFSSGLWTFSILGWPDKKEWKKNRDYHPTSVLETGRDILFFWVARMVLMSTYALGEVPFKDVYLNGLVMDEHGQKMSKSLGNVLDPLELIEKYGTDAVRLSLLLGTTPGQDTRLSEEKIAGFRNFTNKLWNISRFILLQLANSPTRKLAKRPQKTLADVWILSRLTDVTASVTSKIEAYEFSSAGEELRDFTWGDMADWYLEIAKVEGGKSEILHELLHTILKLWHPFMPFVTEYVWQQAGFDSSLILAQWPDEVNASAGESADFEKLRALVTDLRRLRAEQKIEPAKQVNFVLTADEEVGELVGDNLPWIKRLCNAADISLVDQLPAGWPVVAASSYSIALDMASGVDQAKERARLEKELAQTQAYIKTTEAKLADAEFSSKAPEEVVRKMSDKLEEARVKANVLAQRLT